MYRCFFLLNFNITYSSHYLFKIKPTEFHVIFTIDSQNSFVGPLYIFFFLDCTNKSRSLFNAKIFYRFFTHNVYLNRKRRAGFSPLALDIQYCNYSGSFYNRSGPNTSGTYFSSFSISAAGSHAHHFQVWQPSPSCFVMGMGNIVSHYRSFSTYFTYFCHCFLLLFHFPAIRQLKWRNA